MYVIRTQVIRPQYTETLINPNNRQVDFIVRCDSGLGAGTTRPGGEILTLVIVVTVSTKTDFNLNFRD